ncbi:ElaB/YqjD/DUF883 family membrane-anchored ribosome-binding protein [Peribacillus deserti]|uniref:ElaB/YqjD/DUF883 family membrane-anchored ribosome-binding protein n=1 Tax=Peribacillus deserti TaxID=673318 RepID=A0ABS2QEL0_9BACI|nr:transglycosylase SLT domain-containing protein [Peribacillus deserti]MBM7690746.1 ElaB/YqjD/DUF883 family membrane-anchored ribosome-binding protein [Peribacillus deserti]
MKKNRLYMLCSLILLAAFVFSPDRTSAASAPKVLTDASAAAKKLDYYTSGKGATGANIPTTYLNTAKTKRADALKKMTAAQEKTYASTLKTINASIYRGDSYTAAVQGGIKLDTYRKQIEANTKAGKADTNLLVTLNNEVTSQTVRLSKVSPAAIKSKIDSLYSKKAKETQTTFSKAYNVKKHINEANKRIKQSSDSIAPYYKYSMVNRLEVPQTAYKTALNDEFNKLYSTLATKKRSGKLVTYYELEKQMVQLDRFVNPGVSAKEVPDLKVSISKLISSSSFTAADKILLNKRLTSIMKQMELSPAQIKQKLTAAAIKNGVPPEIVKAIAFKESGFKQFDIATGKPFMNTSHNDGGFGIMQVTPGTGAASAELDKARYNIDENINLGIKILLEKWDYTGIEIPKINGHNKNILEDWYFAVLAYNGIAAANDPNKYTTAYQLGVYKYMIEWAQVEPQILDKSNVKLIQNSITGGWYIDAEAEYKTSIQTRSTQMHAAGTSYTFKGAVTARTVATTYNNKGVSIPAGTTVKIVKAGVEDTYNHANLFNWYQVQIPGKTGLWFIASQNFK